MRYFKVINEYPCGVFSVNDVFETYDSGVVAALQFSVYINGNDLIHLESICAENFPNIFEEISHEQYIKHQTK